MSAWARRRAETPRASRRVQAARSVARVVQRQVFQHQLEAAVECDVGHCIVKHGEIAQAEEVHLHQSQRFAGRVVELGDDRAVLLSAHDRNDVDQRVARHDHSGGMHTPLPLQAFQILRRVNDCLDVWINFVESPKLSALAVAGMITIEELGKRYVLAHDRRRHRLGDLLSDAERVAQHPGRILDGLLGLDRPVGDDLADPALAVLLGDIADDLTTSTLVEVDVEVRHRDAVGIEEPLEDQPVH